MIGTNIIGFTPLGIAAGSLAAGIQSSIGNVAAGSLFSILTSIGMTGVAPLGIGAGIIAGLGAGFISLFKKKNQ